MNIHMSIKINIVLFSILLLCTGLLAQTPSNPVVKIVIGGKTFIYTSTGEKIEVKDDDETPLTNPSTESKSLTETAEKEMLDEDDNWEVTDLASQLAATISEKDLKTHLTILASDEFEGRETGKEGQKRAAAYIANQFEEYGLPKLMDQESSYFQTVPLVSEQWRNVSLKINGNDYKYKKDFYCFPKSNSPRIKTEREEVVFLGYGIDDRKYSDYLGVDVKGKIIIIYQGEPFDRDSMSYITGDDYASEWTTDYKKKLQTAKKKGVRAVLMIERNIPFYVSKYNYQLNKPYLRIGDLDPARKFANSMYISPNVARDVIGKKFDKVVEARDKIRETGTPEYVKLNCKIAIYQDEEHKRIETENVLGYIEGTDPYLKNEVVVVTAHYDHLGKLGDDVYNGADDNGSGTSTVLEIAEAFALAKSTGKGARRSVLVMAVSGEEKGLLGSAYYAEEPSFPIVNTVANVNVDMVGRVDEKHKDNPNYIYVIGADRISTDLHKINEAANEKYTKLELDYTYNEEDDPNRYYYRSDHYNFAQKGVPAIFYFNGTHRDYHRITDTVEKINFKKMKRIARLVFLTTWELANRNDRIRIDSFLPKN